MAKRVFWKADGVLGFIEVCRDRWSQAFERDGELRGLFAAVPKTRKIY
jgi:hypothetical protein